MKGNTVSNTSFKDAYGVLQRHAETLRVQDEPNIDDLLTIVTESVTAYQVCKQRIAAVETALKAALDGVGTEAGPAAVPVAPTVAVKPSRSRSAAATTTAAPAVTPPPPTPAAPAASAPPAGPIASFEDMDDDIPF